MNQKYKPEIKKEIIPLYLDEGWMMKSLTKASLTKIRYDMG
jgi:hypothetical protein